MRTLRKYPFIRFACSCGYIKVFDHEISPSMLQRILTDHEKHYNLFGAQVSGGFDFWWTIRIVYRKRDKVKR